MVRSQRCALVAVTSVSFLAGALVFSPSPQSVHAQEHQPPAEGGFELPHGWTMEDMEKVMQAGMPGEMHRFLNKGTGEWTTRNTMWMTPDADPITLEGRCVVTPIMDGRYVTVEMTGDMPGMGRYQGYGIYGYNNVTEEFEATWVDNHSTTMMRGIGQISDDQTTITWDFEYTCPLNHEPTRLREIERYTDEGTKTLEIHGTDAKSGEEYKLMEIELTRKVG